MWSGDDVPADDSSRHKDRDKGAEGRGSRALKCGDIVAVVTNTSYRTATHVISPNFAGRHGIAIHDDSLLARFCTSGVMHATASGVAAPTTGFQEGRIMSPSAYAPAQELLGGNVSHISSGIAARAASVGERKHMMAASSFSVKEAVGLPLLLFAVQRTPSIQANTQGVDRGVAVLSGESSGPCCQLTGRSETSYFADLNPTVDDSESHAVLEPPGVVRAHRERHIPGGRLRRRTAGNPHRPRQKWQRTTRGPCLALPSIDRLKGVPGQAGTGTPIHMSGIAKSTRLQHSGSA